MIKTKMVAFKGRPLGIRNEKYGVVIRNRLTGLIGTIVTVELGGYFVDTISGDEHFFLPHNEVEFWEVIIE